MALTTRIVKIERYGLTERQAGRVRVRAHPVVGASVAFGHRRAFGRRRASAMLALSDFQGAGWISKIAKADLE